MKLGVKNILGVTIGALGTTYFAGKLVDSIKKIIEKPAEESTAIEETAAESVTEETTAE